MVRCDEQGVPKVVQGLVFVPSQYGYHKYIARLFNGANKIVKISEVFGTIPTNFESDQAYLDVEEFVENWYESKNLQAR